MQQPQIQSEKSWRHLQQSFLSYTSGCILPGKSVLQPAAFTMRNVAADSSPPAAFMASSNTVQASQWGESFLISYSFIYACPANKMYGTFNNRKGFLVCHLYLAN